MEMSGADLLAQAERITTAVGRRSRWVIRFPLVYGTAWTVMVLAVTSRRLAARRGQHDDLDPRDRRTHVEITEGYVGKRPRT
ncbi:hypothetical protein HCN51_42355 [Nonomuraea sp. FMUSA5-5]|uniref:Uncharacterized protein n=1 Tax=Nonomuraea composti TaxID=2720023 RepID=A0ABX1BHP2_9ACTN|nr:hypothetical protein [Nonomuraea sp. FMUSA5-5]NJP96007.1 hypothetical protein [Nonomuraea sp. FMUSA5-5]